MAKVILFRGKAGVGKTTLSSEISEGLNIPVIRKDDIYDSISFYIENHEIRNRACYDIMYKIIETNLSAGIDIIVDAGFHYIDQVLQFKTWVRSKNGDFISLLCICSNEEIWAERFNERRFNPQPNNLITDFNELKIHYKDLSTESLENETILDTINNIDILIEKALKEIDIF
jgi:2-phosphoglycerate kinase